MARCLLQVKLQVCSRAAEEVREEDKCRVRRRNEGVQVQHDARERAPNAPPADGRQGDPDGQRRRRGSTPQRMPGVLDAGRRLDVEGGEEGGEPIADVRWNWRRPVTGHLPQRSRRGSASRPPRLRPDGEKALQQRVWATPMERRIPRPRRCQSRRGDAGEVLGVFVEVDSGSIDHEPAGLGLRPGVTAGEECVRHDHRRRSAQHEGVAGRHAVHHDVVHDGGGQADPLVGGALPLCFELAEALASELDEVTHRRLGKAGILVGLVNAGEVLLEADVVHPVLLLQPTEVREHDGDARRQWACCRDTGSWKDHCAIVDEEAQLASV
mmetsp:Transcript_15967/g.38863  ORF Transcript_15967/g.38863 Transcript_15967/m.38863 type:complete len:325 (+) Transcript_15967:144-1118(+)